jgi:hypothetical protein
MQAYLSSLFVCPATYAMTAIYCRVGIGLINVLDVPDMFVVYTVEIR